MRATYQVGMRVSLIVRIKNLWLGNAGVFPHYLTERKYKMGTRILRYDNYSEFNRSCVLVTDKESYIVMSLVHSLCDSVFIRYYMAKQAKQDEFKLVYQTQTKVSGLTATGADLLFTSDVQRFGADMVESYQRLENG